MNTAQDTLSPKLIATEAFTDATAAVGRLQLALSRFARPHVVRRPHPPPNDRPPSARLGAMMLPSAAPMILTFAAAQARRDRNVAVPTWMFVSHLRHQRAIFAVMHNDVLAQRRANVRP